MIENFRTKGSTGGRFKFDFVRSDYPYSTSRRYLCFHMNRIFLTGVPGSRWSGIAQEIESEGDYDVSDHSERTYTHGEYSGHIGAYFGTGMEFPAILDTKNLDLPYRGTGTKLRKVMNGV